MQTRSQIRLNKRSIYEVKIDFVEASECWRANKVYKKNGTYKYICLGNFKNGANCNLKCLPGSDYCKIHLHNK